MWHDAIRLAVEPRSPIQSMKETRKEKIVSGMERGEAELKLNYFFFHSRDDAPPTGNFQLTRVRYNPTVLQELLQRDH